MHYNIKKNSKKKIEKVKVFKCIRDNDDDIVETDLNNEEIEKNFINIVDKKDNNFWCFIII